MPDVLAVDTTALVVDATNNPVEIGTVAPSAILHVVSGNVSKNGDTLLRFLDGFPEAATEVLCLTQRENGFELRLAHNGTQYQWQIVYDELVGWRALAT